MQNPGTKLKKKQKKNRKRKLKARNDLIIKLYEI
jgi:hypothetical protein